MKNDKLTAAVKALGVPVALICLGLAMTFRPDSATVLIGKLLGWGLMAVGVYLVFKIVKFPEDRLPKLLGALLVWYIAGRLLNHPMNVAAGLARLAGVLLLIKGLQERSGRRAERAWVQIVLGGALFLLPLAASRLVMTAGGAVVLVAGILMLADRLRSKRLLNSWEDSEYVTVESDYMDKL